MKKYIALLGLLILFLGTSLAQESYSIWGEVSFEALDDIYLCLSTKETWKNRNEKNPPPPFLQVIKIDSRLKKAGKAPFQFAHIPKGTYVLVAFQDSKKNGKLDINMWAGLTEEPWDTYRSPPPTAYGPNSWELFKFELNKDIPDIKLTV